MRLSEAMMLASVTEKVKRVEEWNICALGISADMAGIPTEIEMVLFGQKVLLNERPFVISRQWPWLGSEEDDDSWLWRISDKFEEEHWSVATLAEWIKTVEPECGECNCFDCTCKPAVLAVAEKELVHQV